MLAKNNSKDRFLGASPDFTIGDRPNMGEGESGVPVTPPIGPVILVTESLTPDTFDPSFTTSGAIPTLDMGDGSPLQNTLTPSIVYTLAGEKQVLMDTASLSDMLSITADGQKVKFATLSDMVNLETANLDNNGNLEGIFGDGMQMDTLTFVGAGVLTDIIVPNNLLTTINLLDSPAAFTVDIENNPITVAGINTVFADLRTNNVSGGTLTYSTVGTNVADYNYLVNTLGWSMLGPVPVGALVTLSPPSPTAGSIITATPSGFSPNDHYSYDWQESSVSYSALYLPYGGGAATGNEDKSTYLRDATVFSSGGSPAYSVSGGPNVGVPNYVTLINCGWRFTTYEGPPVTAGSGQYTFSTYIRMPTINGSRAFAAWGTGNGGDSVKLYVNGIGLVVVNAGITAVVRSTSSIFANTWHHVLIRYLGGDADTTQIWIDGINVSDPITSVPSPTIDPQEELRIGTRIDGGEELDGDMADTRVYEFAVAAAQIAQFNSGNIQNWRSTTAGDVVRACVFGYDAVSETTEVCSDTETVV